MTSKYQLIYYQDLIKPISNLAGSVSTCLYTDPKNLERCWEIYVTERGKFWFEFHI